MAEKPVFVQVAPNSTGAKIQNLALQVYVDPGDGTQPVLQTVYVQAVAAWPVDQNGNPLERDEAFVSPDWQRQLLDETRAIRIGIERLLSNRLTGEGTVDMAQSILEEAQQRREELEDMGQGPEGQIAPIGPAA